MSMHGVPQGITNPPKPLSDADRDAHDDSPLSWVGPAPGTVVLVFVFLAAFITYYFVNWKVLSFLWKIG
jgi:hypothetical protein